MAEVVADRPGLDGAGQVGLSAGKVIRLRRLIDPVSGSCRIVALDHGMTSPVFLDGLADMGSRIQEVTSGGANVLMLGRGSVRSQCNGFAGSAALALMLTASAAGRPGGPRVTPIGSVEEALRLAADAVVVYVALGGEDEPTMISYLSDVAEACEHLGMPLIAEAEFPNTYASHEATTTEWDVEYLARNARLCADLGADIIKVNWSGTKGSFARIVSAAGRPVVLAGGPVIGDRELLARMQDARDVGAVGYSVGRNVFGHRNPEAMAKALSAIFRSGASAEEAFSQLVAEGDGQRAASAMADGENP